MKPPRFELRRPASLADALVLLATHGSDAKIISGGQSLMPLLNLRMASPDILVDIARLPELSAIRDDGDYLTLGATVRQQALIDHPLVLCFAPLLAAAVPHIGHVQTRARGTIGGSLVHADPAAEIPTVVTALDGTLVVRSTRGERCIPASEFFVSALVSAIDDDEILCEIRLPKQQSNVGVSFREISRRHGDFAIASVAVQACENDGGIVVTAVLGGVAETPFRCAPLYFSRSPSQEAVAAATDVEISRLSVSPDVYADAGYKTRLARHLLAECIAEACR